MPVILASGQQTHNQTMFNNVFKIQNYERMVILSPINKFKLCCVSKYYLMDTLPLIGRVGPWKAFEAVCYEIDMVKKKFSQ